MGGREGGAKVKAGPPGPAPLRGGWGRGGVLTPSGTHPWLGVQRGWGRPWGRPCGGAWRNGRESSQCFPCPLRHQGVCWAPGPNSLPSEPPSCRPEPEPHPYTPPRALPLNSETPSETPSNRTGPKPHPHTLTQELTSKLQNSTIWRPPFGRAASVLVLSRGSTPCVKVVPPRPHAQGLFCLRGS